MHKREHRQYRHSNELRGFRRTERCRHDANRLRSDDDILDVLGRRPSHDGGLG